MSNPDATPIDGSDADVDPAEAFGLVADPNRLDIIAAMAEAPYEAFRGTLAFSEIYERTAFTDTGQFNYHLDKLVGPFVRKVEDGYELRYPGRIVHHLAASGLLSDRGEADVTSVGTSCRQCGADRLHAVYEGDRFWVRCEECGRRVAVGPFPPRALANHPPDRAPEAFDRYMFGEVVRTAENVCSWCASPLSASLDPARTEEGWPTADWVVVRTCEHCRSFIATRLYDLLRLHPAVIAFYHDRGVDVLGSTFWAAESEMAGLDVTVTDDDRAATVTLTHGGDRLRLALAEDLRASTIEVLESPG